LIPQFLRTTGKTDSRLRASRSLYIGFYGNASFSDLIRIGVAKGIHFSQFPGESGQGVRWSMFAKFAISEFHIAARGCHDESATEKVKPHVRNLNKGAMRWYTCRFSVRMVAISDFVLLAVVVVAVARRRNMACRTHSWIPQWRRHMDFTLFLEKRKCNFLLYIKKLNIQRATR